MTTHFLRLEKFVLERRALYRLHSWCLQLQICDALETALLCVAAWDVERHIAARRCTDPIISEDATYAVFKPLLRAPVIAQAFHQLSGPFAITSFLHRPLVGGPLCVKGSNLYPHLPGLALASELALIMQEVAVVQFISL